MFDMYLKEKYYISVNTGNFYIICFGKGIISSMYCSFNIANLSSIQSIQFNYAIRINSHLLAGPEIKFNITGEVKS